MGEFLKPNIDRHTDSPESGNDYHDFFKNDIKDRAKSFLRKWILRAVVAGILPASALLSEKVFFSLEKTEQKESWQRDYEKQKVDIDKAISLKLEEKFSQLASWQEGESIKWKRDNQPILFTADLRETFEELGIDVSRVDFYLGHLEKRGDLPWLNLQDVNSYINSYFVPNRIMGDKLAQAFDRIGYDLSVNPFIFQPAIEKIGSDVFIIKLGLLDQSNGRIYISDEIKAVKLGEGGEIGKILHALQSLADDLTRKMEQKILQPTHVLDKDKLDKNKLEMGGWSYEQTDITLIDLSDKSFSPQEKEWLKNHPDHQFIFRMQLDNIYIPFIFTARDLEKIDKKIIASPFVFSVDLSDGMKQIDSFTLFSQLEKGSDSSKDIRFEVDGESLVVGEYNYGKVLAEQLTASSEYKLYEVFEPGRQDTISLDVDKNRLVRELDLLHYDFGQSQAEIVNKVLICLTERGIGGSFIKRFDSLAVFIDPDKYEKLIGSDEFMDYFLSTVRHEFAHALDYRLGISTEGELKNLFWQSKKINRINNLYQLAEGRMVGDVKYGGHPYDGAGEFFASLVNSVYLPLSKKHLRKFSDQFLSWYSEALLAMALDLQQKSGPSDLPFYKKITKRILVVNEVLSEKFAEDGDYHYLFYPVLNSRSFNKVLKSQDKEFLQWLAKYLQDKVAEAGEVGVDQQVLTKVQHKIKLIQEKIKQ